MTTIPGAGTSIVIDPGAAIGLIGSETLRDLLQLGQEGPGAKDD